MTNNEEDKTVAISASELMKKEAPTTSASSTMPKATLSCTDFSEVDNAPEKIELILDREGEFFIGRGDDCTLTVNSRKLSRKHARIFSGAGQWGIEDLNSTNGLFVNGNRLPSTWLKHGDEVKFGTVAFSFKLERPELSAASTPISPSETSGGDEDAEKTMMFGSIRSSEAFLKAASEAREEKKEEAIKAETSAAEAQNTTDKKAAATACCNNAMCAGKAMLAKYNISTKQAGIGGAVIFALLIGLWIPGYLREKEITQSISQARKISKNIIEGTRDKASIQLFSGDYTAEIETIKKNAEKISALAEENPKNLELNNQAAKTKMLLFEREFTMKVSAGKLDEAEKLATKMMQEAADIRSRIPQDAPEDKIKNISIVSELAEVAGIVIEFRRFSSQYPQVMEDRTLNPTTMGMAQLDGLKLRFIDIKRNNNRPLSVDFVVFKSLMDETERRDIVLFNEWTTYFANVQAKAASEEPMNLEPSPALEEESAP